VEHVRSAARCADCEVELVELHELEARAEAEELPAAAELSCVRVAPLPWIRALSGGLEQLGIAHRVEPATPEDAPEHQSADAFGDAQLFGLYVEHEQTAAAQELDGGIAAQVLPGEAPSLDEGEEAACPACGTPLEPDSVECPDCGLVLG
jgi:hypothetical protein